MPVTTDIHPAAARGYTGGVSAYVRGRPEFPPAALAWLRDGLGLRPGRTVIEPGAGTGKFTRLLLETGAAVTAVEPVGAMLCAQSFHWFAFAERMALRIPGTGL